MSTETIKAPRKRDTRDREHPMWCELRLCDVRQIGDTDWHSGNHLDDPVSMRAQDDDVRIEVQSAAFHDTDGTILPPHVKVTVINTALVDAWQHAHLTVENARELAALLTKAADDAEHLAEHYA